MHPGDLHHHWKLHADTCEPGHRAELPREHIHLPSASLGSAMGQVMGPFLEVVLFLSILTPLPVGVTQAIITSAYICYLLLSQLWK